MKVRVRIDAERAEAVFKVAKREASKNVREGLTEGAERQALPKVRSRAPSVTQPYLTVKATQRGPYLTTRGRRIGDRITGLLNYGGTVTAPIAPREAKALSTPYGPKSLVRRGSGGIGKPAVYKPKLFIEQGVNEAMPGLEEELLDAVVDSFEEFGDKG